jgi:hypothetical protein
MRMGMTVTKAFVLLAAFAAVGVLGTPPGSWAQYYNPGALGSVERCSLSGVNPNDHPNIFSNPAVARSYGFVQVNGTWQVSRSLCGRGGSRAKATPASGSAKASQASAKGGPAAAKGEPPLTSAGKCWRNTNGTNFEWGNCP